MICRNEMLLPVVWGKEQCRCRVVPTVSEELQGEEGMSRSTFPKIQLNRIRRPGAVARYVKWLPRQGMERSLLRLVLILL